MGKNRKLEKKKPLPGWLNAVLWSIYGVIWAFLSICIIFVSLLWLFRWVGSASPSAGTERPPTEAAVLSSSQTATALTIASAQGTSAAPGKTPGDVATEGTVAAETTSSSSETQIEPPKSPTHVSINQDQTDSASSQVARPTPASSAIPSDSSPSNFTPSTIAASPVPVASSIASITSSPPPSPTFTLTPTPTSTPVALDPQEYIVQRDDWLSKLSDKFYGDLFAYPVIVKATNDRAIEDDSFTFIEDPDVIEIGQKLWIPTAEEAADMLVDE